MTRRIIVGCELQIPQVTWRVIKGFAGSRRLKLTRQHAVHIVRYFLNVFGGRMNLERMDFIRQLNYSKRQI